MLTGCLGIKSTDVSLQKKDGLYLSSENAIAYAYMKNGDKLEYITFNYEKPKDHYEVIRITKNGFYPDYTMDADVENGKKSAGCLVVMKEENENYNFCRSNYTGRTILGTGVSTLWNAAATVTTIGLNVATGTLVDPKFFDKDKFLNIVKENELLQVRTKINQLQSLENTHNKDLDDLYVNEHYKYKENIKNISFKYIYNDKSGLLFGKDLNPNLKINILNPDKNLLVYKKYYIEKKFDSLANFNSFMVDLTEKLNTEFEAAKLKYKNEYLANAFKDYSFYTNNKNYFELNSNISFNGELIIPKNIRYIYGQKTVVPVNVTINSANINTLAPSSFILKDNNIDVDFKNPNRNNIDVIASNKTNSFLTIKSLTSYFDSDVYTFSNVINRELAPDSSTTNYNSSYPLFSDNMTKKLSLNKITQEILNRKYINYGFAIKYHIQDNNIEKTIFNKRKYSYLELFKNNL
jgi:hypothetical protein